MLFQITKGGSSDLVNSSYLSPLAPQQNSPRKSISYRFSDEGTYEVRACANINTNWDFVTSESNYSNNCSAPQSITITLATLSCTVSNQSPIVNTPVTYTVSGGTTPYSWSPSQPSSCASGTGSTKTCTFPAEGQYDMSVSKSGYRTEYCPRITVGPPPCTNDSATISANPIRVRAGETSTITWSATGVDRSCVISGPNLSRTIGGSTCNIPNGTASPRIDTQSVYRIVCDEGESQDEVVVNVIPQFDEF
jgi:hypothetical protein